MTQSREYYLSQSEVRSAFIKNQQVWVTIHSGAGYVGRTIMRTAECPGVVTKVNTLRYGYSYNVTYTKSDGSSAKAVEVTAERLRLR